MPGCPQYPQSYENTDTQWELLATQEIQLPVEMTNFLMSNDATETKSRLMLTNVCRCDSKLESTSLKGKEAVLVSQSHSVMSGVTMLAWFVLSTVTIYTTQEKI